MKKSVFSALLAGAFMFAAGCGGGGQMYAFRKWGANRPAEHNTPGKAAFRWPCPESL